ncbi:MAG: L-seryl-tRNA(Sec) selenium transferase [Firmicutes bacterium]|nr:L-seryl-tRNA(Sec) selenium transferase [Bacillota bacterium]
MGHEPNHELRRIPPVNELLELPSVLRQAQKWPREAVVDLLRLYIDELRQKVLAGLVQVPDDRTDWDVRLGEFFANWERDLHLRPAINGTGVIIHTNLGRSPLAPLAQAAVSRIAATYSNLEYDLEAGERGSRYSHVEELLTQVTGAEAGLVVNNNAAAVMLVLDTLAKDGEAIVSRGELVEIGGSFRIPEVMKRSGAILREVGTTNKTHLRDYAEAITPETKVILKVHTSNFRIQGFTAGVDRTDLARLAHERGLLLIEDLGSGVLIDLSAYGLPAEPTVQQSIKAGVDIVTFSGDKLLGGPQAGIIVGKGELIRRIKQNQLTRALRIDKMTLAALEATLKLYLAPSLALQEIPTLRMLTEPLEVVEARAQRLAAAIRQTCGEDAVIEVVDDLSEAGGGSLPGTIIPSKAVSLALPWIQPLYLERWLRQQRPPLIARLSQERLLISARTIFDAEIPVIAGLLSKSREVSK